MSQCMDADSALNPSDSNSFSVFEAGNAPALMFERTFYLYIYCCWTVEVDGNDVAFSRGNSKHIISCVHTGLALAEIHYSSLLTLSIPVDSFWALERGDWRS